MSVAQRVKFPPLIPVAELPPMAPWRLGVSGQVWACRAPKGTRFTKLVFDWRCPECLAVATRHLPRHRKSPQYWRRKDGKDERKVTLEWLVARARYWKERAVLETVGEKR